MRNAHLSKTTASRWSPCASAGRVLALGWFFAFGCGGDDGESGSGTGGSSSTAAGSGGTATTTTGGKVGATVGGTASGGGAATTSGGTVAGGGTTTNGGTTPTTGGTTTNGGTTPTTGGAAPNGGTAPTTGGTTTNGGVVGASGGTSGAGAGGGPSACGATGFHVRDGVLYDVNCNEFVMRGVNYPYTWYSTRNTQQDLTAIAATGANTVRWVLATGARWTKTDAATLTNLIAWAKAARLVSVLEVHDTTGYAEQAESVPLTNATSYWTGADISAVLKGQEAYVIVNAGNEPNGNDSSASWAPSHVTAVQALRGAGLTHTVMIDAPNWGQDWQNAMRDGGGAPIWDADSQKNLVFSVHMYDVYSSSAIISNYFNTFSTKYTAPLVVGEFAADHGASGNVDEDTIVSLAENLGIGYLGWSWSGNSSELSSLDMTVNFDSASLTAWGERLINGANGIKATSSPCSCFD